jgi:transcriptional regulator with XRE-family HTH domain
MFLSEKRKAHGYTLRSFSQRIHLSYRDVCLIEDGKYPLEEREDILLDIVDALNLTENEAEYLTLLIDKDREAEQSFQTLWAVIRERSSREAIQTAIALGAKDEDWQEFVRVLKEKYRNR